MHLRMCFVLVALVWCGLGSAQAERAAATRLKAGFISNFLQFTQWPGRPAELTLCGLGKGGSDDPLSQLAGNVSGNLRITIQHVSGTRRLEGCQAIYLRAEDADLLPPVLAATAGRPVLVIADFEGGAPLGATLSLVMSSSGRLGFDVNVTAARAAGLLFNTRLVQLARRVF